MSTYYIKKGSRIFITDQANVDIRIGLAAGTYVLLHSMTDGFYLERTEDLTLPPKFYGDAEKNIERMYNTFQMRTKNTGILLNGEKGSGKTMTLAGLSLKASSEGFPTIIINNQYSGDAFNQFITAFDQPCLIAFDEFDKTYDKEHQDAILTLLDGVFTGKKLFVFTCNDPWAINRHMINRPGRLFYNIRYKGISEQAIREYCADALNNKDHIEGVVMIGKTIDAFNFDMLKGLVEEMNRYNETAVDAVQLMNIRPETTSYIQYKVVVTKDDKELYNYWSGPRGNPLAMPNIEITVHVPTDRNDSDGDPIVDSKVIRLSPKDITSVQANTDVIMVKDGITFTFTKEFPGEFFYNRDAF